MKSLFVYLFVGLLLALLPARADWLNFRGPLGSGYDAEATSPPTTLGEDTLAWKVPLPGRGLGSALLIGDKVIVTAASGPDQKQLHILCFAASDGSPVWERRFWATGRTMTHKKTCVAAPSPASDGERIYALYSSNDLVCLDLNGNLQWMRGLTLDYPNASNSLGMASSPIVADGTLVAQIENDSESFAAGFDLDTGINLWKIDRPKAANWTSPTLMKIADETIVALQSSKGILGVYPTTGSEVFQFTGGAATIPSSAASGTDGILYVPSNGLTALKAAGGGDEPEKLWNESTQRPGTASPIVIGEKLFVINNAGVLSCANRASGERLWRIRLDRLDESLTDKSAGPLSGSPVAAGNGVLYMFSEKGIGVTVDLTGDEGKVTSDYDLGQTILSTPSLSKDAVYIRSDNTLWKFASK